MLLSALALAGCKGSQRPAVERAFDAVLAPRPSSPRRWEGPDPAFLNLKWGPLQLPPGGGGTAELLLVNRGEQPAGPFRIAVYATRGPVVTANRTLLGAAEVASLGSSGVPVVVRFTAPATPGSYAVGIEIDDQRRVAGDDRSNNTSGPAQLLVR